MIECNAIFQREDERQYLSEQNIVMEAWSPLAAGQTTLFNNPLLCQIANAHNKSVPQIILRWLVQRKIVPIVKSENPIRMKENLDILNFTLTEDDMRKIEILDTGHTYATPRNTGEAVTSFLERSKLYKV